MSDPGPQGTHRTDVLPASAVVAGTRPADTASLLRAHGSDYARMLRDRRRGSRAAGSGWVFYASATAEAAGDDPEIDRILVDISVAAQHLQSAAALRAYATAKRRRVDGENARAFLDGMIDARPGA